MGWGYASCSESNSYGCSEIPGSSITLKETKYDNSYGRRELLFLISNKYGNTQFNLRIDKLNLDITDISTNTNE